jgi:hypothetical protein
MPGPVPRAALITPGPLPMTFLLLYKILCSGVEVSVPAAPAYSTRTNKYLLLQAALFVLVGVLLYFQ